MGMIVYHKLTAEITGPDGREWLVTVEPPAPLNGAKFGETKWDAMIQRLYTKSELERLGGVAPEPIKYNIPSSEGMFNAMSRALDLVPRGA